jgi:hypothetical protein
LTTPRINQSLKVSLSSWVLQDGNYADFKRGSLRPFALEFWPSNSLELRHSAASPELSLTWMRDHTYNAKGQVLFIAANWHVLDVGIRVYRAQPAPADWAVGRCVRGEIGIAIDHFSYFESLSREIGSPALIYDWRIENVALQTAPLIETRPQYLERDATRLGWREIPKTDAWKDDSGHAEYLLTCALQPGEPRHRLKA